MAYLESKDNGGQEHATEAGEDQKTLMVSSRKTRAIR